jgi:NhaP-type Na+/H+ and K+/H+ antiporter
MFAAVSNLIGTQPILALFLAGLLPGQNPVT